MRSLQPLEGRTVKIKQDLYAAAILFAVISLALVGVTLAVTQQHYAWLVLLAPLVILHEGGIVIGAVLFLVTFIIPQ